MKHSDIFIRSDVSLDAMAELLRTETGLPFEREVHGASVSYIAIDAVDDRRIALLLNKDDEPPFDRFSFDVEVDGYDDESRVAYTRQIFDKLVSLGTMHVLLTDDFVELDSFEPKQIAAE